MAQEHGLATEHHLSARQAPEKGELWGPIRAQEEQVPPMQDDFRQNAMEQGERRVCPDGRRQQPALSECVIVHRPKGVAETIVRRGERVQTRVGGPKHPDGLIKQLRTKLVVFAPGTGVTLDIASQQQQAA